MIQAQIHTSLLILMMISGVLAKSLNVSYDHLSSCALKGSSVEMSCYYSHPPELTDQISVEWMNSSSGQALEKEYVHCFKQFGKCSLRLPAVNFTCAGNYYCHVTCRPNDQNVTWDDFPGVTLSVTDLNVKAPSKTKDGDNVTLSCSTTCSLTGSHSFLWSKDGHPLNRQIVNNELHLHPFTYEDEGSYTCAVKGNEGLSSPHHRLQVMYPPKNIHIRVNPSGEITEGSHVTLTCMSTAHPPVHTYTWVKQSGAVEQKPGNKTLTFTKIRPEDSGEYLCQAANVIGYQNSTSVFIKILYSPRNTKVVITPSGGSVNITCRSDANPPVVNCTWFKMGLDSPVGLGPQCTLVNISSEEAGQYYCVARNQFGAENSAFHTEKEETNPGNVAAIIVGVVIVGLICVFIFMYCKKRNHSGGSR